MAHRWRVRFIGGLGHELDGRFEVPDAPAGAAVFAPCFTCPKDAKAIVRASRALADSGIAVLRYDVTGTGDSAGSFTETSFSSQIADLEAAAAYATTRFPGRLLVIGMSLGGAVAVVTASRLPAAAAVATVNAPADTVHLRDLLLRRAPEILDRGSAEVTLFGATVQIGRTLLDDLPRHDVEAAAAALGLPLMIFHAPADAVVPIDNARRLFTAAHHPKSFVAIDRSDHLMLDRPEAADFVGNTLAAWARDVL
jgi:putative redox protein